MDQDAGEHRLRLGQIRTQCHGSLQNLLSQPEVLVAQCHPGHRNQRGGIVGIPIVEPLDNVWFNETSFCNSENLQVQGIEIVLAADGDTRRDGLPSPRGNRQQVGQSVVGDPMAWDVSKNSAKLSLRGGQPVMPPYQQIAGFAACCQGAGRVDVGDLFEQRQGTCGVLETGGSTGRQKNAIRPIGITSNDRLGPFVRFVKLQFLQGHLAKMEFQARAKQPGGEHSYNQQHGNDHEDNCPQWPGCFFGHEGAHKKENTRQENCLIPCQPS